MDIEVISLINQYKVYMPLEEQRVVDNRARLKVAVVSELNLRAAVTYRVDIFVCSS